MAARRIRVAIIGGGPSGLTTLKYLKQAHQLSEDIIIEARLFESEDEVGGTFRYRTYEDAELVSSKYLTTFSDFRCPYDGKDFLSAIDYCKYLNDYATHFDLWPQIHLSTKVTGVRRIPDKCHMVSYSSPEGIIEEWECDAVAVCSGLHVQPNLPYIKGIENVPEVIHSSQYKEKAQFGKEKSVMILGTGETGMDIAYFAVTSPTKTVTLCHRDGFLSAPKVTPYPDVFCLPKTSPTAPPNIPTDCSFASLFDTAYVHPLVEKSQFLFKYYTFFVKYIFLLITGTTVGFDQWVGGRKGDRLDTHGVFFNKSTKAVPYISAPYRSNSLGERIRRFMIQAPLQDTHGKVIDLAPWPEYIDEEGVVHFTENGRPEAERMRKIRCQPDLIIQATGYLQSFPFLDSTYAVPSETDFRGVWKSGDDKVAFIGFVRPGLGAIPPLSELQAQLWVLNLVKGLPQPVTPDSDTYFWLDHPDKGRVYYAVEHETYAYQLARDMRTAPSFTQVLSFGPKVLFVWAIGTNFNTKFRLVGPWKWYGAADVMRGELWKVVKRRGGVVYDVTSWVIPFIIVGTTSLVLYTVIGLYDVVKATISWPFIKSKQLLKRS